MAKPDPEKIAALLGAGASVIATLPTGENALTYAIAHDLPQTIIANLIDQAIADKVANLPDGKGVTPLFAATEKQLLDTIVKLVINAEADLEQLNGPPGSPTSETPLMLAFRLKLPGAIDLLVKLGADPCPAWDMMQPETKEALIRSMPAPHEKLDDRMLDYAIASAQAKLPGDLPVDHVLVICLERLLTGSSRHISDVRFFLQRAFKSANPLACKLAEAGDTRLLSALTKCYQLIMFCEASHCLSYAIRNHPKLVPALLSKCEVNVADEEGNFPLVTAVETGDLEMVKLLVADGAIITSRVERSLSMLPRFSDEIKEALPPAIKYSEYAFNPAISSRATSASSASGASSASSASSISVSDDESEEVP